MRILGKTDSLKPEFHVLLIENDPNQAYYFQNIFHNSYQATFRVNHQQTVEAGLYHLGQERVDVILLDLSISNQSQLDLVQNLCTLAPTIPIIVLGEVMDDSFGLEVIKAGGQDYLRKENLSSKPLIRTILYSIERMRLALSKQNDPLGPIPSAIPSSTFPSQTASALEMVQRPAPIKEAASAKQNQENLAKSDARFYQFISSLSVHVYVTKISPTGDFENLYLSPNIETLTGYSQQKFWDDWSFWPTQVIHPADRKMAQLQANYLASGINHETEYRLIRADGQVIWVRDSGRVEITDENRIIYGVVSDITERKRTELEKDWLTEELRSVNQSLDQRVRERTTELQAILDAVGEGVAVTDLDGIVQYINPAMVQMTGYDKVEAIEQLATLWENNEQNKLFYTQMWQTVRSGQTWRGELKQARKDNTLYDTLMTVTPIWGLDKKPLGFVSVQSDITPLKEMDRIKSSFLSTAAHELRTPLTSIQGFSEILLTRDLPVEQQRRYLIFINQQSNALADIINDLLDLARLEAGHGFEMNMKPVDLGAVVDEIMFGFRENNPHHSYHLNVLEAWPGKSGGRTFSNIQAGSNS